MAHDVGVFKTLTAWGPAGSASAGGVRPPPASPWRPDASAQSRSETGRQQEDLAKNAFCPVDERSEIRSWDLLLGFIVEEKHSQPTELRSVVGWLLLRYNQPTEEQRILEEQPKLTGTYR